jgi:hypothetical protein
MSTPGPDPTRLIERVNELRKALVSRLPETLAANTGASLHLGGSSERYFALPLWQREIRISYPELIARDGLDGQELPSFTQALLMYHFHTADGAPVTGQWISFSELPDGRFYNQAYQGYTGGELARMIQSREAYQRVARKMGGTIQETGSLSSGSLAYCFQALPRMPLLVTFWEGDEDFPGTFQVLFDASARHFMPTDGCALLGSALCRMLIKSL